MSYPVRPDPVNGKRMQRAVRLFAAAMVCAGGSMAWTIVSNKGGRGKAGDPQTVAVCGSVLFVLVTVPLAFVAHARLTWRYRCPQCGTPIRTNTPRRVGTPVRHQCDQCRVVWDTGWKVPRNRLN
jgi:predicted RNA-binding Zn-ribbon protein involved in translation (DUF1610 family)